MDPSDELENQPYAVPAPGQNTAKTTEINGENPQGQPQIVYMTRPLEPVKQPISPGNQRRHAESVRRYPFLNLSQGEYVISNVRRHPIGLYGIWSTSVIVIVVMLVLVGLLASASNGSGTLGTSTMPLAILTVPVLLISLLVLLFAAIGTYVYRANWFFLTNESVIQNIQKSLFSKRLQTISLGNIEDASFSQDGIMAQVFKFGQIRLSTPGNETTYRFNYAANPEKQIALLNDAVEAFKNGRPISE